MENPDTLEKLDVIADDDGRMTVPTGNLFAAILNLAAPNPSAHVFVYDAPLDERSKALLQAAGIRAVNTPAGLARQFALSPPASEVTLHVHMSVSDADVQNLRGASNVRVYHWHTC